jgi:hypothetical protein
MLLGSKIHVVNPYRIAIEGVRTHHPPLQIRTQKLRYYVPVFVYYMGDMARKIPATVFAKSLNAPRLMATFRVRNFTTSKGMSRLSVTR